jgi:hypothetical protein
MRDDVWRMVDEWMRDGVWWMMDESWSSRANGEGSQRYEPRVTKDDDAMRDRSQCDIMMMADDNDRA